MHQFVEELPDEELLFSDSPDTTPGTTPAATSKPGPGSSTPLNTNAGKKKLVVVNICSSSGLLAGMDCPDAEVSSETFTEGEEPTTFCNVH